MISTLDLSSSNELNYFGYSAKILRKSSSTYSSRLPSFAGHTELSKSGSELEPLRVFLPSTDLRTAGGIVVGHGNEEFIVQVSQLPSASTKDIRTVEGSEATGDWTLRIFLDGVQVEYLCTPGERKGYSTRELLARGQRSTRLGSTAALISPFVFSAAAGSDTVSVNGLKDVSASHNTDTRRIRLEIHRVHILEGNTRPKEVSSAQLRETVWHAPSYRVQPRDPLDSAPWVVFEFKYMSRDELKHVHRQLRPTFHSTRRAVSSPNTFSNLIPAANLRQKGLFNIGTRREHYALLGIESPARPAKKARHNIMYSGN